MLLKIFLIMLCIGIGIYGYRKRVIDKSGFLASLLVGIVVITSLPLIWFVPLFMLFALGGITARYKWDIKKELGVAERKEGRSYANVLGNGLVPIICALSYLLTHSDIFLFAYLASVAEACGDSVATEIGELSKKKPRLITNFRPVRIGTSGAISLKGEIAGFLAILLTVIFPSLFLFNFKMFIIPLIAAFIGIHIDSLIGAILENKVKFVNNHTTNFLASLSAALISFLFISFF